MDVGRRPKVRKKGEGYFAAREFAESRPPSVTVQDRSRRRENRSPCVSSSFPFVAPVLARPKTRNCHVWSTRMSHVSWYHTYVYCACFSNNYASLTIIFLYENRICFQSISYKIIEGFSESLPKSSRRFGDLNLKLLIHNHIYYINK